jgi:NAD(P)-dependent dehydrogenase (short-subunit alcohol dehydrogenase family)
LAAEGARVALVSRTKSEVEAVATGIRSGGGSAEAFVADVSSTTELEAMHAAVFERFGQVDILVNNAGANILGAIAQMDPLVWWNQVETCLRAAFLSSRAFVPGMVTRKWGRVINVSSRFGKVGAPLGTSYCTAKHGLIGFTRALALEVAESGVTANAICPGQVETRLMSEIIAQRARVWGVSEEDARKRLVESSNPQKRMLSVEDVTPAVMFLCSDHASRVTGEAMNVSGGSVMH